MRLSAFFPLCLLGVSLAYEIPHDLEDGIWHVEFPDTNNHSTAILKRGEPIPRPLRPSRLFKRQEPAGDWEHYANWHGEGVSGERNILLLPPLAGPPHKGGDSDAQFHGLDLKPPEGHIPHLGVTDNLTPAQQGANKENNVSKFLAFNCRHNEPKMIVRDYLEAKENLYRYCDAWKVNKMTAHISMSKSGSAVAYMCNFAVQGPQRCSKAELVFLEKRIMDAYCGQYVSGYANAVTHSTSPDGKREEFELAYGRGSGGNRICGPLEGGYPYVKLNTWTGMPDPKPPAEKQVDWKAIADMRQANLTQHVAHAYKHRDMLRIDALLEEFFRFIRAGEAREKVKELWMRRFYIWDEARRMDIEEMRLGQAMNQSKWWDDDELPDHSGRFERRQKMRAELVEIEAELEMFGVLKTGIRGLTDVENLVYAANLAGYKKDG